MRTKSMMRLAGVAVLTIILLMGYRLAVAAPTGELTIVTSMMGYEIPITWEEQARGNDYMKLLYDPLVGTTPDEKGSTEMGLAEKWELSPDGLSLTFRIRKGVKFHNGVEVTAKDVKFTIDQLMGPTSRAISKVLLKEVVRSVEVRDIYTLVVQCKKPYLFLPEALSDIAGPFGSIMPKDYFESVGRDKFVKNPIGSGPYKWHSQMVGSFIKLEATDKHWRDGVPRYKYVTIRIIPEESTQKAMLKAGEADISRIGRESVKEIVDAGFNVISKKNSAMVVFQPNGLYDAPGLSDIRLRKALNLAIDKEAIIKHIFGGRAKPTTTYPGANIAGVRDAPLLKPYPYDPGEARRLIKEGGYEGFEFQVPSYARVGCPELPQVVEAACGNWEKVGLKPKIFNIDVAKYLELRRNQKTKGHVQVTNTTTSSALSALLMLFRDNLYSTMPMTLVKDPKADEMLERAERSTDRSEVEKVVANLYRYMYDNYVFIPICDIDDEIATSKKVPKWEPSTRRNDININDMIKQR